MMIFWPPAPAAILTRRKTGPKRMLPTIRRQRSERAFQYQHASAAGQERLEDYAELQDDIHRLYPPGRGKFHRQVPHGHLRTGPGAPGFGTMVKGTSAQAGMTDKAYAIKAPCAVATVTGSCGTARPSSAPRHQPLRARGKRGAG